MTDDLIAAHAHVEALAPYLHLPVQSGSDRILASMNRRHRAADYLAVVDRVRRARPDVALSSDFIVGYPGETDADFAATLALVREVGFASSYAFKYSPRPGTPAAEMAGQVGDAVKAARLAELQAVLEDQKQAFNRACVGQPPRRPVREAGPPRGPGDRTLAVHAGRVRGGTDVAHRQGGRGRDRRRQAELDPRANCLASVVKAGFDRKCRTIRIETRGRPSI